MASSNGQSETSFEGAVDTQDSSSGPSAAIVPEPDELPAPPPGYVRMWSRTTGRDRLVPEGEVPAARAEGLSEKRFDVADARREWQAAWDGARDAISKSLDEIAVLGFVRAETGSVMDIAAHTARDKYNELTEAIGVSTPQEDLVASVAERLADLGHLNGAPALARYENLARQYPAEKLATFKQKNAGENSRRDQLVEQEKADAKFFSLAGRVRDWQIAGIPVEIQSDGQVTRFHRTLNEVFLADPETGEFVKATKEIVHSDGSITSEPAFVRHNDGLLLTEEGK